jgi:predicted GNAT superfamily acetyltransferase
MKLTADQTVEFRNKHKSYESDDIHILLNGQECRDVIKADEEKGYVVVAMRNDKNEFYVINDEVATETRTGEVRIELPSWWPK